MPKVKAGGGGSSPTQQGTEEPPKNVFGTGPDQYTVTVKPDETITVIVEE